MRILYLVQTYKDLPQIIRLVQSIRRSDPLGAVLITHNQEAFVLNETAFQGLTDVHVINFPQGSRIDFSLPAAYLDAIEYAYRKGIAFDWVINLTGQCYPARPLGELVSLLEKAQVDAFIDHHKVFAENKFVGGIWSYYEAHSRYRYQYRWRLTRSEPALLWRKVLGVVRVGLDKIQPWIHLDTSYALQIGVRDRSGVVAGSLPLFGGSYYMTLSRRAVDYLYKFTRTHPEIVEHFSRMNVPSEVYPHTVLANNPDLNLSSEQHFFFDVLTGKRGRPAILGTQDFERIAASGAFFARKFAPSVDSAILDALDERVLGVGRGATSSRAVSLMAS